MINIFTPPFSFGKKTAHAGDISTIAEDMRRKLQTDSENPAFEKLANNPMLVNKRPNEIEKEPVE